MKKSRIIFLLLSVLSSRLGIAQETHKQEFGFRTENDAYLAVGQDRYYTNGLFINYRLALDQGKLKGNLNKVIWGLEAGHKMFTPESAAIRFKESVDRPFAGYAYIGSNLHFLYQSERSLKINLQVGVIGSDAKGKETQEVLHQLLGFYEVSGWEYQVNNEFGLNTNIEYNSLLFRDNKRKTDFILNSYVNLGNTFAGAGSGITFRAGKINPLYHSTAENSLISKNSLQEDLEKKEIYFYAQPMLNFIAYDASIQGPMFKENKGPVTYEIKPLVFSQRLGLAFASSDWTLDFSVIFKSRELKSPALAHQYGSLAIYRRF